jgi:hypothetical protein
MPGRPPFLLRKGLKRVALLAALLAVGSATRAQPSETAVKAAFLSKFAAYVTWPPSARPETGEPLLLCLVGGDPFGRLIDEAARGQQIDGHPLAVKRIPRAGDAAGCAMAFVASSAMLDPLKGRPVLTVTDARTSVERGMIHFVVAQGRVRFHIDEAAAVRSGLTINSRLLALALSVRQRG